MNTREANMKQIKRLLIIEVLIFYFCILNLVSHARGPVPYQKDIDYPLLQAEDFQPFFDMGIAQTDATLPLLNTTEGRATGYQGDIILTGIEGVYVSFQIECPTDEVGKTIVVDLYNVEAGYDLPEQEKQIVLQAGLNEIDILLSPGQNAPESAQLRIFTVEAADFTITELGIFKLVRQPKITGGMMAIPVAVGILCLGTLLVYWYTQKKESFHNIHQT